METNGNSLAVWNIYKIEKHTHTHAHLITHTLHTHTHTHTCMHAMMMMIMMMTNAMMMMIIRGLVVALESQCRVAESLANVAASVVWGPNQRHRRQRRRRWVRRRRRRLIGGRPPLRGRRQQQGGSVGWHQRVPALLAPSTSSRYKIYQVSSTTTTTTTKTNIKIKPITYKRTTQHYYQPKYPNHKTKTVNNPRQTRKQKQQIPNNKQKNTKQTKCIQTKETKTQHYHNYK